MFGKFFCKSFVVEGFPSMQVHMEIPNDFGISIFNFGFMHKLVNNGTYLVSDSFCQTLLGMWSCGLKWVNQNDCSSGCFRRHLMIETTSSLVEMFIFTYKSALNQTLLEQKLVTKEIGDKRNGDSYAERNTLGWRTNF